MKYDLSLPYRDFRLANYLVRAVLLTSGRSEFKRLRLITSDSELLLPDNQLYIEEHPECLGVCFGDNYKFDIWVSPQYHDITNDKYVDTILHELTHGYLGLFSHNQRFRRFLGRVLYHYNQLVRPIDVGPLVEQTLNRYTKTGQDESYTKYLDRIHQEHDAIEKLAVDERDQVAYLFKKLCGKQISPSSE